MRPTNQSVYAFNQPNISERRDAANEKVRALIAAPQRVAYGRPRLRKSISTRPSGPNAPTLVYIHGGSWRSGRSSQLISMAEPYINRGRQFRRVDFNNIFESPNSFAQSVMTTQPPRWPADEWPAR